MVLVNRIEQLIFLEAYCIKNNCKINYYWENKYTFRTYKNLFICKNIIIQDKIKHKIDNLKIKTEDFSKEELYNATKNITLDTFTYYCFNSFNNPLESISNSLALFQYFFASSI